MNEIIQETFELEIIQPLTHASMDELNARKWQINCYSAVTARASDNTTEIGRP